MKSYSFWGIAAALFILLMSGCLEKRQPMVELNVYTSLEEDEIDDYYQLWKRQHPNIKLKFFNSITYDLVSNLDKAMSTPDQADVVWGCADDSVIALSDQGLLYGLKLDVLNKIRPDFLDKENKPPKWVASKAYVGIFATNSILAAASGISAPESYSALLDPKLKGRIAMPDPLLSGVGLNFIAAIIYLKGSEAGWKYLEALFENVKILTASGSEPAKLAGRGEEDIVVGISFAYRAYREKNKGAPLTITSPAEGCSWGLDANAIIKHPQIKPEVFTFMNWTFSRQMMESYLRRYPVSASKNGEFMIKSLQTDYPKDIDFKLLNYGYLYWKARNYSQLQKEWKQRFGSRIKSRKIISGQKNQ